MNLIRPLIIYFGIIRQTVQDSVPKVIMRSLMNHTSRHVQDRLVSMLYKPELLHEHESFVLEGARVKAKVLLDTYKDVGIFCLFNLLFSSVHYLFLIIDLRRAHPNPYSNHLQISELLKPAAGGYIPSRLVHQLRSLFEWKTGPSTGSEDQGSLGHCA